MTPDHACGPPYPGKRVGCCLCCSEPVYEVRAVRVEPGHPLDGHPIRLGPMLDEGTQVEFLLSDGSEAAISFCLDCAMALRPEHYRDVWLACVERADVSLRLAGRSETSRRLARAHGHARWPLAIVRNRREVDGLLVVDRRG